MQTGFWLFVDQMLLTYMLLVGLTALLSRLPSVRRWLGRPACLDDHLLTSLLLGLSGALVDLLVVPLALIADNARYIPPVVAGILGGPVSGVLTGVVIVASRALTRWESLLAPGVLAPPLVGLAAGLLAQRREGRVSPAKTAAIAAVALLTDWVLDVWLEKSAGTGFAAELSLHAGNLVTVMICVSLLQWEQREGAARQHIETLAYTDELTRLHNYRSFRVSLENAFRQCRAAGVPLSLVLMDVDEFKQYNDRFGHPAGNQVLERVGAAIRAELRATDIGARYGGDEFALILPNTTEEGARSLVQRIQERLDEELRSGEAGGEGLPVVRLTPGVASYPATAADPETLVKMADEAMYLAKRADAFPGLELAAPAAEVLLEER